MCRNHSKTARPPSGFQTHANRPRLVAKRANTLLADAFVAVAAVAACFTNAASAACDVGIRSDRRGRCCESHGRAVGCAAGLGLAIRRTATARLHLTRPGRRSFGCTKLAIAVAAHTDVIETAAAARLALTALATRGGGMGSLGRRRPQRECQYGREEQAQSQKGK